MLSLNMLVSGIIFCFVCCVIRLRSLFSQMQHNEKSLAKLSKILEKSGGTETTCHMSIVLVNLLMADQK
jgi:hypothetical protein